MDYLLFYGAPGGNRPVCFAALHPRPLFQGTADRSLFDSPPGCLTTFAPSRVRFPPSDEKKKEISRIGYLFLLVRPAGIEPAAFSFGVNYSIP